MTRGRGAGRWYRDAVLYAWVMSMMVMRVAPVAAQDAVTPGDAPPVTTVRPARVSRLEVSLLGGVFGGGELGSTDANLLTNQAVSGQTLLFTTRTEITAAPVVEGRVGMRLLRAVWVEGGLSYAQPELVAAISRDSEGAADVRASSRLTQVVADGGVQYRWSGRRVAPFVMAGGGYLRQLDDARTTTATGSMYYGGGGVLVRLAPAGRGWLGRLALRGDVRAAWLRGAIRLQDERGPAVIATAGLTARL